MAYPVAGYPNLATARPQGSNLQAGEVDVGDVSPVLLAGLSKIAAALGQTITIFSGYRSSSYSASVGGFAGDPHTKGYAVDASIGSTPIGSYPGAVPLIHAQGFGSGATDFTYNGATDPSHVDLLGTSRSYSYAAQLAAGGGGSSSSTPGVKGGTASGYAGTAVTDLGAPSSSTIGAAIARIVKDAQGAGLDPAALLSVAQAEGNWGVPGDSRSSFGPFSLHQGGALNASPGEQYYQQGWQYASAWAWSQEGVDWAVGQIAKLAPSGSVHDIVYNFENPGDPAAETVRAQGFYGKSKDVVTAINEGWSHNSFESTIEQGALASLNIAGTSQAQQVIGQIPVVGPAIDAVGNAINAAAGALDWLKDPTRILQLLLGGALVLLGLFLLARPGAVPA